MEVIVAFAGHEQKREAGGGFPELFEWIDSIEGAEKAWCVRIVYHFAE